MKKLYSKHDLYEFEALLSKISISKPSCHDVLITKLPAALGKSTHQRVKKVFHKIKFLKIYYSTFLSKEVCIIGRIYIGIYISNKVKKVNLFTAKAQDGEKR